MRVEELAQRLGATLHGDGSRVITGVAALENAGPQDLTFAEGERALERAIAARAGCLLIAAPSPPELVAKLGDQTTLAVKHPKLAFIQAAAAICPKLAPVPGIHPSAEIAAGARLGENVTVGPLVVVGPNASVGARTRLAAGVVLGEGAVVGADCVLHPKVVLYPGARLGNRVILHAGVVVGSDGFGYVFAEGRQQKFPQLGQVIIEDDVEVGANTTVDRGSLGSTVIGEGTKIDNLVQVAHNVRIGKHVVIAAQTGISGSVEIGDYVVIGGQVGIAQKARLEAGVVIGAQAGILPGKVIRSGSTMWGTPARPLAEFKKLYAHFSNLPRLAERVRELAERRG
ncbi:MAG TPA: UDP-3-O-(3-hydroxymyristoyl)glucosamine N-acyltransferase [Terriglobia bacterium]|nr:UDP-3-O-(3-hydroxymyristoyl)glucosamine N-acyltransferase [Terriglobia bacterium]